MTHGMGMSEDKPDPCNLGFLTCFKSSFSRSSDDDLFLIISLKGPRFLVA